MDKNSRLVQKKENKNSTSTRNIPIMIDELYDALSAAPEKSGFVATCHPNTIYRQVNKICEKNGLPNVAVHGLRHSFASLAYHLGARSVSQWKLEDGRTIKRCIKSIYI